MSNNLKYVKDRIICRVDTEQKNHHTFENGQTIRVERGFDNFDRKHTEQVLGEVVSSESIPLGAMVLFNHNSLHQVNEIFNHSNISGADIASGIKMFSIPETECYLWKMEGEDEWHPTKGFVIADRVFQPYNGIIEGIPPTRVKNVLYIKTGEFAGKVAHVLKASDYEIVFRNEKGVEERIIRCRHFEDQCHEREEIVAINHELTDKVESGELLVGLTPSSAKSIQITAYAD